MNRSLLLIGILLIFSQANAQVKKPITKRTNAAASITKSTIPVVDPWKLLNSSEKLVEISTDFGVMIAKLYDSTPLHRDNFVKLVEQKFYDSLLFHRIISGFMIQGGDPQSKNAPDGVQLGSGSASGERIPAEFKTAFFHKKGALAAARDNNPQKASSNCQFYIVQGKPAQDQQLNGPYTSKQKEIYTRIGGTPFLDQNYTVFGEVISGLDVIDKIANQPKNPGDRPIKNISMTMRLLN